MTVKFLNDLDPRKMPNGVILVFSIRYAGDQPGGNTRGRTNPKIYDYAMLKSGGLWYVTGAGQSPQAAGWGAVEKWLTRNGREVVRVEIVTGQTTIFPVAVAEATQDALREMLGDADDAS